MILEITPAQYQDLVATIRSSTEAKSNMFDNLSGTLATKDVTLAFSYDGAAKLDVEVTACHSWKAQLAPQSMIDSRITQMFNGFIQNGGTK